jgi:hypothetical protein
MRAIAPVTYRRATTEAVVTFQVDHQADPGDVVPSLARLLIDIDRRRQAQQAGVVCRVCGMFYGYLAPKPEPEKRELLDRSRGRTK